MRSICSSTITYVVSISSVLHFRVVLATLNQLLAIVFSRFYISYANKLFFHFFFMRHRRGKYRPNLNRAEGSGKATKLRDISGWQFSTFSPHFLLYSFIWTCSLTACHPLGWGDIEIERWYSNGASALPKETSGSKSKNCSEGVKGRT